MASILRNIFPIFDVLFALIIMRGKYEDHAGRTGATILSILLIVSAMLIKF